MNNNDTQGLVHKQEKQQNPTATSCAFESHKVKFARMGGKAGTGSCKKRSPEHYKKMVEARWGKKIE